MQPVRAYDLPTRVLHWTFAALFTAAYTIANAVDDDSSRFAWHMLAGLLLGVAVLLRIAWGIVGTRYARFSDLCLDPRELVAYLKGVVVGGGRRWPGHNPASSWAAVSMMAIALALAASGVAMVAGTAPEWVEEVHELLANLFLAVVLLHIGGLVVHSLRYRDMLPAAMVSGRKRGSADGVGSVKSRPLVALAVVVVLLAMGVQLLRAYDANTHTLDVFGTRLLLTDNAGRPHEARGEHEEGDSRGDD